MASAKDFYPLTKGLALEYKLKDAEGEGRVKFEVLSVEKKGGVVKAKCQRTITRPESEGSQFKYTVTKDPKKGWVSTSCWGKEFPLPPVLGKKWNRYPDGYSVDALDATAKVPAGEIKNCLRVLRLIAGGDGGGEERYFAPGVGLVYIFSNAEAAPYDMSLLKLP